VCVTKFDKRNPDAQTLRGVDGLRAVETRSRWYGSLYIVLCLFSINFNFIYVWQTHRVARDIDVY
jgi:hypothetical protein